MSARRELSAAALAFATACSVVWLGACAHADAADAPAATAAKVDPEVEPLPPSPKRRMRDPRGAPVLDAGLASARPATDAAVVDSPIASPSAGVPVVATCGTKADPCPMQRFMHGAMETAHTPDTLTAAFTRVAGMSPDPSWSWVAIATRGADLANAGDIPAAKGQCKACHDAYREPYRTLHRARSL